MVELSREERQRVVGECLVAAAFVVVLVAKLKSGVHSDQWFHLSGLFDNLRSDVLLPDLGAWNFRPLFYRLVLACVSVVPLNLLGWSTAAFLVTMATYYTVCFGAMYWLASPKSVAGSAFFGIGLLVLGSQDNWSSMSADEVAVFVMVIAALLANRFELTRQRWLAVAIVVLVLILTKGIVALYSLPMLVVGWHRWGWRSLLRSVLLAVPVVVFTMLFVFRRELIWLVETYTYHRDARQAGFGFDDLRVLIEHDMFAAPVIVGVVVSVVGFWSRRAWMDAAVSAVALLAAIGVDAAQGQVWAYHGVGLYGAVGLALVLLSTTESASHSSFWDAAAVPIVSIAVVASTVWAVVGFDFDDPGTRGWLTSLSTVADNEQVLYLGYGTDRATTGYPYACGYFSAHPIQRVTPLEAKWEPALPNSREFLRCAIEFDGAAVLLRLDWFDPAARGYTALAERLCERWSLADVQPQGVGELTLLLPGPGELAPFCS